MTPEEQALEVLFRASNQAPLPKSAHDQCTKAVILLKAMIDSMKKEEVKN